MNLMISVNDQYCVPAKVMLSSFLRNNAFEHNDIYFLYGNVSENNIESISFYIETKYDASFHPIKIDAEQMAGFPVSHHFSIETYYRFWAQEVLPDNVDRVLWLDADMIVRKSLKEFYYQDFENKHLVVCQSINKNSGELLRKLDLSENTVYFNAGTILFNLKLIKEKIAIKDYFDYIESNREKITWLDQDVLNALFCGKTKIDNYKVYNMQMFSEDKFTQSEQMEIEENSCIIHYIGALKPWDFRYKNPCGKYYIQYAKDNLTSSEYAGFMLKRFLYKIKTKLKNRVYI